MFGAPPPPTSVLEALIQRLEKFKGSKESALAEGNNSKVRRLDRIIKVRCHIYVLFTGVFKDSFSAHGCLF